MSSSLVRKALSTFEEFRGKDSKQNPKNTEKIPKKTKTIKKRDRKQNRLRLKKSTVDLKMKCVLEGAKKQKHANHTARNLKFLKGISTFRKPVVSTHALSKIVKHHRGRLTVNQDLKAKQKEEEPEETAFTEADFEAFEKSYFIKE